MGNLLLSRRGEPVQRGIDCIEVLVMNAFRWLLVKRRYTFGDQHVRIGVLELIRNNLIDATIAGQGHGIQLHQNQFGGTFGGRILRDKLVFAFCCVSCPVSKQQVVLKSQATQVPTAVNLL